MKDGSESLNVQPDSFTDQTIKELKEKGASKIWDAETKEIYYENKNN